MKTLSIGITTFKNRLADISKQIDQIRSIDKNIEIILAITNNYGIKMDEEYRKNILKLCIKYDKIYPLMFPRYTGLAKMWNNIIIHSSTTHTLILNDDLDIANPMLFNNLRIKIQKEEIIRINMTFGHFIVSKECAHEVGYFDERLIAYGEEDGDFIKRYENFYEKPILNIQQTGLINRSKNRFSDSYDTGMDCHKDDWGGNKPTVNVEVINLKNSEDWKNLKQYPYEKFINDNYHNIGKFEKIIT